MGNSEALSYHLKIYLLRDETRLHLPTWRPSSPMSLPSNWQRNRQPCFLTWYTRQGTGKATRPMTSQAIMRLGERSWQWLQSPLSLRLRKLYLAWRAHPTIYKTGQGKMTVRHCCSIHSTSSGIGEGVARSNGPSWFGMKHMMMTTFNEDSGLYRPPCPPHEKLNKCGQSWPCPKQPLNMRYIKRKFDSQSGRSNVTVPPNLVYSFTEFHLLFS